MVRSTHGVDKRRRRVLRREQLAIVEVHVGAKVFGGERLADGGDELLLDERFDVVDNVRRALARLLHVRKNGENVGFRNYVQREKKESFY